MEITIRKDENQKINGIVIEAQTDEEYEFLQNVRKNDLKFEFDVESDECPNDWIFWFKVSPFSAKLGATIA